VLQACDSEERDGAREEEEEDPFGFLTTPIKVGSKPGDAQTDAEAGEGTPQQEGNGAARSVPDESPLSTGKGAKKKVSKSVAPATVSGPLPVKNPDKIVFDRVTYSYSLSLRSSPADMPPIAKWYQCSQFSAILHNELCDTAATFRMSRQFRIPGGFPGI
jgi:hypothetical protein